MVLTVLFARTGETPATRHIMVQRPDPNAAHTYIESWGHSGSQVAGILSNGNLNISGSYLVNGVATTGISQTNADARYVNTSGDTMTGALRIRATASGSNIHADNDLTASGNIIAETGRTISGSLLRASRTEWAPLRFSIGSGTALAAGTGLITIERWPAQYSGAVLRGASIRVSTLGTTNATLVKLVNITKGKTSFFSTPVQIDSLEYSSTTAATPYVINSSIVAAGGDLIMLYVPQVSTTAPTGLSGSFDFRIP